MLDIDRFKAVNDGFGHGAGDAVLSELGDGFHFTVIQACDNGEPGVGHDTFEISVKELSYSSQSLGTVLTGGNLQLH